MENLLEVYAQPWDESVPVLCFDERPCQLLDDVLTPVPCKVGRVAKRDYEYARQGTCVVLLAIEPLTGKRFVEVRHRRTKRDYAEFLSYLSTQYPTAKKIRLVQDNLNTHNPSSFYDTFSVSKAFEMMTHFEMIYTPKKASWLNMAEIEFSALSKQCFRSAYRKI